MRVIILHDENNNCFYIIITSSSVGRQQARESLGGERCDVRLAVVRGWETSNRGHLYGRLRDDDDRIHSRHVRGERMIYTRSRFCINLGERRRHRRRHRIITKPINISNYNTNINIQQTAAERIIPMCVHCYYWITWMYIL